MLPSPSSSPRVILENRTNVFRTPTHRKASLGLPTPPGDAPAKRRVVSDGTGRRTKRFKPDVTEDEDTSSESEEGEDESDMEMEDIASIQARMRRHTVFQQGVRAVMGNPANTKVENGVQDYDYTFREIKVHGFVTVSTRLILQSFVSSNKSDVFKCQSTDVNAYLTPPYACSYSHSKSCLPKTSYLRFTVLCRCEKRRYLFARSGDRARLRSRHEYIASKRLGLW